MFPVWPPKHNGCSDGNERNTEEKRKKEERDTIKQLLESSDEKDEKIKILQKEIQYLVQQNKETERRSQHLTSEMANMMDIKGTFENTRDEYTGSKIADRFKKLYSNDWVRLLRWITKTFPSVAELQIIHYLTKLMKYCYQECRVLADNQLRHFIMLDMKEGIPNAEEHQELFSLRRKYAMTESTRSKIKRVVSEKLDLEHTLNDYFKGENEDAVKEKMKDFFNNYLECCWLMVSSNPPMRLNFDVVGKAFDDCKEHFSKYSSKKPVKDMEKDEDTIYEVVWPSVCLQDSLGIFHKGDVVIVKEGRKPNKTDHNKHESEDNTHGKDVGTCNTGENESSQTTDMHNETSSTYV